MKIILKAVTTMKCETCDGTGKSDYKGQPCFLCDGTGSRCDICGEAVDERGQNVCNACQKEEK